MTNPILQKALNQLQTVGARLIAGWVSAALVYLEVRYQIVFDADTKAGLVTAAVGIFGTAYPIIHKTLNKWLNPGDAASTTLGKVEKAETQRLKAESQITPGN